MTTTPAPASLDGAPTISRHAARVSAFVLRYAMVWILASLLVAAGIVSSGFFDTGNLQNILSQNAPIGLVAAGMTFVILAGGFDLSVGAIYACGAVVFAKIANDLPTPLAGAIALAVGAALGAMNGVIVTQLKVNPFVATLGTGSAFGGAAFLYSDSAPIINTEPGFAYLGTTEPLGIPLSILLVTGVMTVGGVVLARTIYGRNVYAVGGNAEAARLSGKRVDLIRTTTYVISGTLAALGGMLIASRLGLGQADISGSVPLDAIAIVIIGGTSLLGGEGAMWRTAVGLLILATLNNLFDSLALDTAVQQVVKGVVVVVAVALDSFARRLRT